MAGKIDDLFSAPPRVVNLGLEAFARDLEAEGAAVVHLDWSPPAGGDPGLARLLARLGGLERVETANREALARMLDGDPAHRLANVTGVVIPDGVPGEPVRAALLQDFGIEIGTSFGPLHGRIWRIGTMGHVCREANVVRCLDALEAVLRRNGFQVAPGAGVTAAEAVYRGVER